MNKMLEPIDLLKEIKRAFETNLIGVADRLSIEKRLEVIKLRIRIDKAIKAYKSFPERLEESR